MASPAFSIVVAGGAAFCHDYNVRKSEWHPGQAASVSQLHMGINRHLFSWLIQENSEYLNDITFGLSNWFKIKIGFNGNTMLRNIVRSILPLHAFALFASTKCKFFTLLNCCWSRKPLTSKVIFWRKVNLKLSLSTRDYFVLPSKFVFNFSSR